MDLKVNKEFEKKKLKLGLGLHFSILSHQLPVKMAVEKTVKNSSYVKPKTNHGFL